MTTRWLTHRQDGGGGWEGGSNTWVGDSVSVDLPSARHDGMPETMRPRTHEHTEGGHVLTSLCHSLQQYPKIQIYRLPSWTAASSVWL